MKPEAAAFLAKAEELLARAPALLAQNFADEAGRAAYLAGYHAAQALLFETYGRAPKTHGGVQSRFADLVKDRPEFGSDLRAFLGQAYNLKAIADYEAGPGSKVAPGRAQATIEIARRFVAAIVAMLPAGEDGEGAHA